MSFSKKSAVWAALAAVTVAMWTSDPAAQAATPQSAEPTAQSTNPDVWIPDFDISITGAQADGQLRAYEGDLAFSGYVSDTACDSYGALLQIYAGNGIYDNYDGDGCNTTAVFSHAWAGSLSVSYVRVRVCRARQDAVGDFYDVTCGPFTRVNKAGHW